MKTFQKHGAQGEISLSKVTKVPTGLNRIEATNGRVIVGHSETGHDHTASADCVELYEAATAPAGVEAPLRRD